MKEVRKVLGMANLKASYGKIKAAAVRELKKENCTIQKDEWKRLNKKHAIYISDRIWQILERAHGTRTTRAAEVSQAPGTPTTFGEELPGTSSALPTFTEAVPGVTAVILGVAKNGHGERIQALIEMDSGSRGEPLIHPRLVQKLQLIPHQASKLDVQGIGGVETIDQRVHIQFKVNNAVYKAHPYVSQTLWEPVLLIPVSTCFAPGHMIFGGHPSTFISKLGEPSRFLYQEEVDRFVQDF